LVQSLYKGYLTCNQTNASIASSVQGDLAKRPSSPLSNLLKNI
jgi:hypothetical protein